MIHTDTIEIKDGFIYELVQSVEDQIVTNFFTPDQLLAAFEIRSFHVCGKAGTNLRPELQGQPKFTGLLGPTWDGYQKETGLPIIRYEETGL